MRVARLSLRTIACAVPLLLCSCDPALRNALNEAGENRGELKRVLEHYSGPGDKLKYDAACFLIENMPYCYYYDDPLLDRYMDYYRIISKEYGGTETPWITADSIRNALPPLNYSSMEVKRDISTVDAEYLLDNIEWAFKVWQEQPWNENLAFDEFCEYLLPYRLCDEKPSYWRAEYYNRFMPIVDSLRGADPERCRNKIEVVKLIMNRIGNKEEVNFTASSPAVLPHVGPHFVAYKSGSCRELADYAMYVCRALGIACHLDYMIVRGTNNVGHLWVSYSDGDGQLFVQEFPDPPLPATNSPLYMEKKNKVYRRPFSYSREGVRDYHIGSALDVTPEYCDSVIGSVTIPLTSCYDIPSTISRVYLSSPAWTRWRPVARGERRRGGFEFTNLQPGSVVRLSALSGGSLINISDPFIISYNGDIRAFRPEGPTRDVIMYSKYSIVRDSLFRRRMVGGVFEGSNTQGFSECETIYRIEQAPYRLSTRVKVSPGKEYRYIRYRGPLKSNCNIAELTFLNANGDTLRGRAIAGGGDWSGSLSQDYLRAFDNNTETSADCSVTSGGWLGLDLGRPETVSQIVYAPRNFDNYIRPGDEFELFVCDTVWKSHQVIVSKSDSLKFTDVPQNALLYLKNHSRGMDERVFTVDESRVMWQ